MKQITLKWFWIKCFTYLSILVLLGSCTPDFQKPHYKKRLQISKKSTWKRRGMTIFETDAYRNPLTKKEKRREMLNPKTINLDDW